MLDINDNEAWSSDDFHEDKKKFAQEAIQQVCDLRTRWDIPEPRPVITVLPNDEEEEEETWKEEFERAWQHLDAVHDLLEILWDHGADGLLPGQLEFQANSVRMDLKKYLEEWFTDPHPRKKEKKK